ncbi:DUF3160 domain-containing protein [Candidatus Falkowbacteria bacterium]|jgi:hypothetical protein|nr:DUF3160 domain-containing protein [Candidatus Falkowbacteria bacterium]
MSNEKANKQNNQRLRTFNFKKTLSVTVIILLVLAVSAVIFVLVYKSKQKSVLEDNIRPIESSSPMISESSSTPSFPKSALTTETQVPFSDLAIEYLAFADFYKTPDNTIVSQIKDYSLPVNVKIDVANYYDLSRKLNLDDALDDIGNQGFSLIPNPWNKEAPDFYSVYEQLKTKQIPVLITSDFIFYYYQNSLKKIYKDIEENIFYDNLWSIVKDIYNSAKNRYEARLAAIGPVNDSILEGERLEVAFFAVALELLSPTENQISLTEELRDNNKFSASEANKFYFVTPSYLGDDIARELKLIRDAKEETKSPVMLYQRNYKDFVVPADYRDNAKLNNFYLASRWLNSVFPLNYQDKNCPNCLLDKEDWRLSMIAASLISKDFSDSPELKNKWARIYKVMSYFGPLREDLNYVYYRDALKSIFGEDYDIEEIFDDKNSEAQNNFQKLQNNLKTIDFSPFLGAIDKNDSAVNSRLGFKMLVEPYSPNDYIFKSLTSPAVSLYQGEAKPANITSCLIGNAYHRCNGIALDIINLLQPITNNAYFEDNTNYLNYEVAAKKLSDKLNQEFVWHTNNYWSTLFTASTYLNMDKSKQPIFAQSAAWRDKNINTAVAAWINMQLPLDKVLTNQEFSNFSRFSYGSYVEPNLYLVNELIAENEMMKKMFTALQIDFEVPSVATNLAMIDNNLLALKKIITKELTDQPLDEDDNKAIIDFTENFIAKKPTAPSKRLTLKTAAKNDLVEDLSLKLMVLLHQDGDAKILSVGPVWSYQESR